MKIGIPKGMYIYEKPILYEAFFKELGCEVIYSDNTSKKTMQDGIKYSIDEACLASKIYMGHVKNLIERKDREDIDYIFIPRICTFENKKSICVKFFAMYDICRNIFDAQFLSLNIDYEKGETEFKAFVKLGLKITKNYPNIIKAYLKARSMQKAYDISKLKKQYKLIERYDDNKKNILIVSHPYISYDNLLGSNITKYLKELGANIIYANINSTIYGYYNTAYQNISKSIYWKPNINLLNGINEYINDIDGIVYLSVFPCGPDSLVSELLIRKIKDIPSINLILDEQEGVEGLYTRLESFYDILEQKSLNKEEEGCYDKIKRYR